MPCTPLPFVNKTNPSIPFLGEESRTRKRLRLTAAAVVPLPTDAIAAPAQGVDVPIVHRTRAAALPAPEPAVHPQADTIDQQWMLSNIGQMNSIISELLCPNPRCMADFYDIHW